MITVIDNLDTCPKCKKDAFTEDVAIGFFNTDFFVVYSSECENKGCGFKQSFTYKDNQGE
jgi:hypothetical protein